jgi:Tfp pilus assembly protein PilP
MEKCIKILPRGIISALCLFFLVSPVNAGPPKEIAGPAYKDLRPQKQPFDPDRIPDPFLSYLVKRGQQATARAEDDKQKQIAAEERLKKEKQAAAEKLKELLVARTELQKLALSQLTLTAIVQAEGMAWAMVRDPKGRGFVVKKGTRIGTNGGVVDRIARKEKKVIVKEPYLENELYIKYKNVEMKLPDQVYE